MPPYLHRMVDDRPDAYMEYEWHNALNKNNENRKPMAGGRGFDDIGAIAQILEAESERELHLALFAMAGFLVFALVVAAVVICAKKSEGNYGGNGNGFQKVVLE